jgi:hypothetical protein
MQLLDPNAIINLLASILTLVAAAIPFLKESESRRRTCGNRAAQKKRNRLTTGSVPAGSSIMQALAAARVILSYRQLKAVTLLPWSV